MPFALVHDLRNHCEILTPHEPLPAVSPPSTHALRSNNLRNGVCRAGSACVFSAFAPLVQPSISSFGDHEKRFVNRSYLDRRPGREWLDATCRELGSCYVGSAYSNFIACFCVLVSPRIVLRPSSVGVEHW